MEVRVNGAPFAVIMRTPGTDRELAAGFLLAEDVVRTSDELLAIELCEDTTEEGRGNTLNVTVSGEAGERLAAVGERRQVMMTSSCGLCGRRTIETLRSRVATVDGRWTVPARSSAGCRPRCAGTQRCSRRPAGCMRRDCSIGRVRCSRWPRTWAATTPWTRSSAAACSRTRCR